MTGPRARFRALAACAALACALAPGQGAGAAQGLGVGAKPSLYPTFRTGTRDYVVRCSAGKRVRLSVSAPPGTRVAVGDRSPRSGSFTSEVGLAPGRAVELRSVTGSDTRTYSVRCLPKDFPRWTVKRDGKPQAAWYLLTPSRDKPDPGYVAVVDTNGAPVWWMRGRPMPFDAHILPDGNLAWTRWVFHATPSGFYEEHALDGSLVRTYTAPSHSSNPHDLKVLPDGSALLIRYQPRDHVDLSPWGGPSDATVLDGKVYEVDPQGKPVWTWSTAGHVATAETSPWFHRLIVDTRPVDLGGGRFGYDIVHMNSVEPVGTDRLVVSLRHTDAVFEVDRATGDVVWKLGGTKTPQSLKIVGDPYASKDFRGQHDARVSDDGRTLTLFDNGSRSGRAPRSLQFRIDVEKGTATLVRALEYRPANSSICCGSARRLPGGNWVTSWGGTSWVTEQTPSGRAVFALKFHGGGWTSYRAEPVLPGRLSRTALRAGMDAMIGP